MGSFALYAVLNGVVMSFVFLAYTGTVIFQAFAVSAGMFAVMSLWAVTTKRDLSGWGHYLFMGLVGLIIAGVVGIFVGGETYQLLYSSVGVILFTALTAYDTQMIKKMSDGMSSNVAESDFVRLSIIGALKLYLDFINMFLFLLRIFGRRR
jgi:FtsH-binding integral membrane protein